MDHDTTMTTPNAFAKWPNVPACYDWLSLDARGQWRLQGERVSHTGLIDFLNRHYGSDQAGNWFVQNGPQRVFVALASTPWVFRLHGNDFVSHTGLASGPVTQIWVDADGRFYLHTTLGIGLLDDRDLPELLSQCQSASGALASDMEFEALLNGFESKLHWNGVSIQAIAADSLPARFGFIKRPCQT